VELANLAGEGLDEVINGGRAWHPADPGHHHLAFSFLRYCGLSLW
jgi:hypothetical protein